MSKLRPLSVGAAVVALCVSIGTALAAGDPPYKTAKGLTVYLGVVPAEIVKGPLPHSAERPDARQDSAGPSRISCGCCHLRRRHRRTVSDASVTAQISGLGLSGTKKTLEPMEISGTTTYGGFFYLPGSDLYTVRLTIERQSDRAA
jgi:hypothetical protein